MNLGFTVSPHVINTINALPASERSAICSALSCEFILGEDPQQLLNPVEYMIYSVIRFYVKRDSSK